VPYTPAPPLQNDAAAIPHLYAPPHHHTFSLTAFPARYLARLCVTRFISSNQTRMLYHRHSFPASTAPFSYPTNAWHYAYGTNMYLTFAGFRACAQALPAFPRSGSYLLGLFHHHT